MPSRRILFQIPLLTLFIFFIISPYPSQAEEPDLSSMSLKELMDVDVVTASRRAEPLSQVAGAVRVIDEEDIKRSGATSLPEILKLVPGVHVARVDIHKWAVGMRGFNGLFGNKQLVMIDGRPITLPSVAGVFWAANNIPVESIKRVEVVRGVWTSLWGSDSFTGVINIITKKASETQGGQSVTTVGLSGYEQTLRYGGELGESGNYRVYSKGALYSGKEIKGPRGETVGSREWKQARTGIRTDWDNAYTDELSFQADFTGSRVETDDLGSQFVHMPNPPAEDSFLGYGQFTWDRATGLDSNISFRTSFTREKEMMGDMANTMNVFDMEFTHVAERMGRHLFTSGIGGRYYWDNVEDGRNVSMNNAGVYSHDYSAFVQDKITLVDDSLYLILGNKFGYDGKGGVDLNPTARILYTRENEEYWLAVSRAVRKENRWQRGGSYDVDYHGRRYRVVMPDSLDSEKLISYEAGYRRAISNDLKFDLSAYVNDYDQLLALDYDGTTHTAKLKNILKGTALGMEALLDWRVSEWLTLKPSVSVIHQYLYDADANPSGESMPEAGTEGEIKLQIASNPFEDIGFDTLFYYINAPTERGSPGYFSLDTHLSWKASDDLTVELIGQNLLGAHEQYSPLRIGPSVDLRVTWDF